MLKLHDRRLFAVPLEMLWKEAALSCSAFVSGFLWDERAWRERPGTKQRLHQAGRVFVREKALWQHEAPSNTTTLSVSSSLHTATDNARGYIDYYAVTHTHTRTHTHTNTH